MPRSDEQRAAEAPGNAPGASGRASGPAPLVRTLVLSSVLGLASLAVSITHLARMAGTSRAPLPWWALALAFAAAEALVFHVEVRREAISFSVSEIPLTLALFFAAPLSLVIGRVVGEAVFLIGRERQQLRKACANLAQFAAECVVALEVFHALPGTHQISSPITWASAALAVGAADALTFAVVITLMRWHGAPVAPAKMAVTNGVTAAMNTTVAVLAAVLLDTSPAAALLLVLVLAVLVVAYRGYTALTRRYASLQLLYDFTRLISVSKDPDTVLSAMLQETKRLLRAEAAGIAALADGRPLCLWLGPNGDAAIVADLHAEALCKLVADGHAKVVDRHDRSDIAKAIRAALGVTDCIVAPLVEGAEIVGVLIVADRETAVSTFDAEDGRIFETLANHAGIALENGRLIARLHQQALQREHEALHDPLTELPNRANFQATVNRVMSESSSVGGFGVALLDLDHFKEVNDTLGHHHGDLLLREVATRLRAALPESVMLARLGGDEFAFVTGPNTSASELVSLGHRLQQAFEQPFAVDGLTLEVGVSIGCARYPDHGRDPATLLQRADVAMYDAKSSALGRVAFYDASRDLNSPRRLALATDLRAAIEGSDLELHYQPQVNLTTGAIHGAEALVRWRHSTYGDVLPDDFVPLAERTGLIHPFTDLVVGQGIRQLQTWSEAGLDLSLSLNLSTRNLLDTALPGRIDALLATTDIDPRRVTFEVTETSMMAEPEKALRVLNGLAELGVRLSIDDFGTGHSTLAYLQRLPVQEVKIDKSFISALMSDRHARAIVRSVIQLAHNLELAVVAEGIEDQGTWDELVELGCDYAQGYHLCRPTSSDGLLEWITNAGRLTAGAGNVGSAA